MAAAEPGALRSNLRSGCRLNLEAGTGGLRLTGVAGPRQKHAMAVIEIAPEIIAEYRWKIRENIASGEILFRKAWIHSIAPAKDGNNPARIAENATALQHAIAGNETICPGVRRLVRKWRARQEAAPFSQDTEK